MGAQRTVLCVVGTRPEAIKMAPVVLGLGREPWARVRVLATAQHREMLDQVLEIFGIRPDVDLNIMESDQKLPELTARLITALDHSLEREHADVVLAQGDTTTVLATALACFYRRVPFGHVGVGVQEEAPALGKPVLVLRAETERPEAVAEGVVKLVGPACDAIVSEARRLLDDPSAYAAMAKGASPYGDGRAAERIVALLRHDL